MLNQFETLYDVRGISAVINDRHVDFLWGHLKSKMYDITDNFNQCMQSSPPGLYIVTNTV